MNIANLTADGTATLNLASPTSVIDEAGNLAVANYVHHTVSHGALAFSLLEVS